MLSFLKIKKELPQAASGNSFRSLFWERFRRNRPALWSLRILYFLLFVAVFAGVLANDKPLYSVSKRGTEFPVFKEMGMKLGVLPQDGKFKMTKWQRLDYESVIWPPVPYSSVSIDLRNARFKSPFDKQKVESFRWRHHLGTDILGRDVLAGLIHGTRTALSVGLLAMFVASMLGIFFGTLAGWFGNQDYKMSRGTLFMILAAAYPAWFYGFQSRAFTIAESENAVFQLFIGLLIAAGIFAVFYFIGKVLSRFRFFARKVRIPLDVLVMRLIEVFNSIPALLMLLAAVAVLNEQSIIMTMLIIGFLSWTPIARFVRAELLRIKKLPYIESARALGLSNFQIISRHALPNALTPVLITITFGVAGAVLVETTLSFLGIGVGGDEITWGALLSASRSHFSAWWLAVFPGFVVFITVTVFNLIGEGLSEAMEG